MRLVIDTNIFFLGFQPKELLLSNHSESFFKKILFVNINSDFT